MIGIKLKPCPFCGSESVSFVADRHAVVCRRCKARGGIAPDEDMALSMWNDRRAEPLPAPRAVHVGSVATFESVKPDKAQALKVLEEAAEVFGAWQLWDGGPGYKSISRIVMLNEIADVIQAACNLAAALGVTDFAPYMERCHVRNSKRGRYGNTEEMR